MAWNQKIISNIVQYYFRQKRSRSENQWHEYLGIEIDSGAEFVFLEAVVSVLLQLFRLFCGGGDGRRHLLSPFPSANPARLTFLLRISSSQDLWKCNQTESIIRVWNPENYSIAFFIGRLCGWFHNFVEINQVFPTFLVQVFHCSSFRKMTNTTEKLLPITLSQFPPFLFDHVTLLILIF